ncbi:hypothetical protein [Agromyces sp. NPDC058110]|uniref:hypothetical protein n=1 Tax=Agromyces sp. NPDC058110 TaxID=3346345 RepID=UPI0036DB59D5
MDPNTARQVLRIFPDAPLTADLVERAFAGESGRTHATPAEPESANHGDDLQAARAALLAEIAAEQAPPSLDGFFAAAAAPAPRIRTRLGAGAIIGIVLACMLTVATWAGGAVALVMVLDRAGSELAASDVDPRSDAFEDTSWSDRMTARETGFTFPSALEVYADGRYDDLCSDIYERGCWELDVIPERACADLKVEIGLSNDELSDYPDETRVSFVGAAEAFERVPLVYGEDEYTYGWITDVTCEQSATA